MKRLLRSVVVSLVALFAAAAFAQPPAGAPRGPFPQGQLDQMLAPIALYPDSLLSQILMAAAYPRDVFEAAAWSRDHPELRGAEAVRAVQDAPWDPSVVALAAFPQVLAMMDERREWTEDLGQAFVEQPRQLMDTVQELRARADAAGNLRSGGELLVERRGYDYVIEPASPEVVYVPYYDPRVVYGPWWWADYPPVWWNPWPGYSYRVGYGGFGWGYGIPIGSGFWFGSLDWPRRYVRYGSYRPWYWHGRDFRRGDRWTHDRNRYWNRDGHWRDANRDGRWRDGTRDGRWRDGPRDGTRDGRWRDGNRDRQATSTERSYTTRPATPQYRGDSTPRTRPQYREQRDDGSQVQRAPVQRSAPVQRAPVERSAPAQRPAPVERSAPVQSAPNPAARPAERTPPERPRESTNPAERGTRSMQR